MLNNPNIHPKLAFEYCGMFVDPELAYSMSMKYKEEQQELQQNTKEEEDNASGDNSDDSLNSEERE